MAIRVPKLQTFCFCIALRTGVKIIGFLSLIACIILALLSSWEIAQVAKYIPESFAPIAAELGIDVILQCVQIGTSIFLLQGVYQEKPRLMRPWMYSCVVMALVELLFIPSLVGRLFYNGSGNQLSRLVKIDWLLFSLVMLVDDVYGWLVVYSYYRTLSPQI